MTENPFLTADHDRHSIWEILVTRDFEAFVAQDWSLTGPDFWAEGFFGIDAHQNSDPDRWTITFPNLDSYRDDWLQQATKYAGMQLAGVHKLDFLYQICRLDTIEVSGDRALAHKKFNGSAATLSGDTFSICFQSVYRLMRFSPQWKIAGFVGYLPYSSPNSSAFKMPADLR
jgi:hypothetical protein